MTENPSKREVDFLIFCFQRARDDDWFDLEKSGPPEGISEKECLDLMSICTDLGWMAHLTGDGCVHVTAQGREFAREAIEKRKFPNRMKAAGATSGKYVLAHAIPTFIQLLVAAGCGFGGGLLAQGCKDRQSTVAPNVAPASTAPTTQ